MLPLSNLFLIFEIDNQSICIKKNEIKILIFFKNIVFEYRTMPTNNIYSSSKDSSLPATHSDSAQINSSNALAAFADVKTKFHVIPS